MIVIFVLSSGLFSLSNNAIAQALEGDGAPLPVRVLFHDQKGERIIEDDEGERHVTLEEFRQVTVSATVHNYKEQPQPSVTIFRITDSSNVVIFLAWQESIIPPTSRNEVGVSWIPEKPGDHSASTFHISSFEDDMQILSTVGRKMITVVDV